MASREQFESMKALPKIITRKEKKWSEICSLRVKNNKINLFHSTPGRRSIEWMVAVHNLDDGKENAERDREFVQIKSNAQEREAGGWGSERTSERQRWRTLNFIDFHEFSMRSIYSFARFVCAVILLSFPFAFTPMPCQAKPRRTLASYFAVCCENPALANQIKRIICISPRES